MLSTDDSQTLASLFESDDELPSDNKAIHEFIKLLDTKDPTELGDLEKKLKLVQKKNPEFKTLLSFLQQYRKVNLEHTEYAETLEAINNNLNIIKKSAQENTHAELKKVTTDSYFKILELSGHHVSMYQSSDEVIRKGCIKSLDFSLIIINLLLILTTCMI